MCGLVNGDRSLADQFPELYGCARNGREGTEYMERSSNAVVWTPIFRRNLLQSNESSLLSLLQMLGNVFIPEDGIDCRWWDPSKEGTFSIASFAEILSSNNIYSRQLDFLWELKAPLRVILFGWLALEVSSLLWTTFGGGIRLLLMHALSV